MCLRLNAYPSTCFSGYLGRNSGRSRDRYCVHQNPIYVEVQFGVINMRYSLAQSLLPISLDAVSTSTKW